MWKMVPLATRRTRIRNLTWAACGKFGSRGTKKGLGSMFAKQLPRNMKARHPQSRMPGAF